MTSSHPFHWAPPIALLGVPFDNINTEQALARIETMIASRRPHFMATANVDFVVQAMHDPELRRILNDAHLVLCDGQPLVWASRFLGNPLPERVAGSDLVPQMLRQAEANGHGVFFLGGQEEVAAKAVQRVREMHPKLRIAGVMSPPFAPLLNMDHEGIARTIRESGADIVLVSFGCPKQEKWLAMNYRKLGAPVCIGVGATIDFLAGAVKRAPMWMRRTGLEWVFRLAQEPRRLFKRYLTDLFVFGIGMARQIALLHRTARVQAEGGSGKCVPALHSQVLELPVNFTVAGMEEFRVTWREAASSRRPTVVDGSKVATVDSTGIAMLVRLQTELRAEGHAMVLAAPSPAVRRALRVMHLEAVLDGADSVEEGLKILAERRKEGPVVGVVLDFEQGSTITWNGEVTAITAPAVWKETETLLAASELRGGAALRINLSSVRFVDSTGVGLMVRTKKHGDARGVAVSFAEPSQMVRQIIRTLRMEAFLFESNAAAA